MKTTRLELLLVLIGFLPLPVGLALDHFSPHSPPYWGSSIALLLVWFLASFLACRRMRDTATVTSHLNFVAFVCFIVLSLGDIIYHIPFAYILFDGAYFFYLPLVHLGIYCNPFHSTPLSTNLITFSIPVLVSLLGCALALKTVKSQP